MEKMEENKKEKFAFIQPSLSILWYNFMIKNITPLVRNGMAANPPKNIHISLTKRHSLVSGRLAKN